MPQTCVPPTRTSTCTADPSGYGRKGLVVEVATVNGTGEAESVTRTDLYDVQANSSCARIAWQCLQLLLQCKDAALDTQIATRFADHLSPPELVTLTHALERVARANVEAADRN